VAYKSFNTATEVLQVIQQYIDEHKTKNQEVALKYDIEEKKRCYMLGWVDALKHLENHIKIAAPE